MAAGRELLYAGGDGTLAFGNHRLGQKEKLDDFSHGGDIWKVKTYKALTRLEKNGILVFESVPGTTVSGFRAGAEGVGFTVEGDEDAQITIGLAEATGRGEDMEYDVHVGDVTIGRMATDMGGKLTLSVELAGAGSAAIKFVAAV